MKKITIAELDKAREKKVPFDNNPKYGGLINFASNGVVDETTAFDYGFRLGWQTCWYEINGPLKNKKSGIEEILKEGKFNGFDHKQGGKR